MKRTTQKQWWLKTLIAVLVLSPISAYSAVNTTSTDLEMVGTGNKNLAAFIGLDSGYTGLETDFANERNKGGWLFGAKGLFSLYTDNWVFDLGGGWVYNDISGTANNQKSIIRTRAGFAEFSPRYRLDDSWQLGIVSNVYFGVDTSFSEQIQSKSTAIFLGPEIIYEIQDDTFPIRIGAKGLTDLNISGRQLFAGLLTLQIGFSLVGDSEPAVAQVEQTELPEPVIQIDLDEDLIHFKTNSTDLADRSKAFLRELGRELAKSSDNWIGLRIGGHTDERGSFEYNLQLSLGRAESVKNALIEGTLDPRRLETLGYSFSRPIDPASNKVAWAKNRRVELKFSGVNDALVISDAIETAKRKTGYYDKTYPNQ